MTHRRLPVLRDLPPPSTPGQALYVPPIRPGSGVGRLCLNCIFWVGPMERCTLHDRKLSVTSTMVCGYHVAGNPLDVWIEYPRIQRLAPALSGLAHVAPPGTMCGNCRWFSGDEQTTAGVCMRVAGEITPEGWTPAEVDAEGCCAQWENET